MVSPRPESIASHVWPRDRGVDVRTLESVLTLAVDIAREGREGRKIGTIFVVGDSESVMQRSKSLILDPLAGHPEEARHVDNPNMRETVKELAQLDGAFIVRDDGVVLSACRYLNASSNGIDLPLGLGSRHMAAASITRDTHAVGIVVSESTVVRVFEEGRLIAEVIPEGWSGVHGRTKLRGEAVEKSYAHLTVLSIRGRG